jgi:hypothetical protein
MVVISQSIELPAQNATATCSGTIGIFGAKSRADDPYLCSINTIDDAYSAETHTENVAISAELLYIETFDITFEKARDDG